MNKAKKLLIIDIVIVIAIILVMFGVYINSGYTGTISHVAKETKKDPVLIFNNKFAKYIVSAKNKGEDISFLVDIIITSNKEYNKGKLNGGNLISLKYEGLGGELEDVHIIPDVNDIKEKEMLDFVTKIDKEQDYYVYEHRNDDCFIDEIIISYLID